MGYWKWLGKCFLNLLRKPNVRCLADPAVEAAIGSIGSFLLTLIFECFFLGLDLGLSILIAFIPAFLFFNGYYRAAVKGN